MDLLHGAPAGPRTAPARPGSAPHIASSMVWRRRLLELLDAASDSRVVVVAGPAGYGKTTLLAQWAASDPRRVVWLTVHSYDTPAVLAEDLVQHLAGRSGGPPPALPLTDDTAAWFGVALPAVGRIVAAVPEPVLVVIDDVAHLQGTAAEALLETVIEHLPPGSQLALATRQEPQRVLRRLRPGGDVVEIGPDLLALDPQEAQAVLSGLGVRLEPDRFDALLERTEGWPVGLYLLALGLGPGASGGQPGDLPSLTPGWVTRYIRDELVEPMGRETAAFLRQVCVLDQLTGPACDAVTGTTGSLARLRALAESNSLLVVLDAAGERFRLHPLLADVLRSELLATSTTAYQAAHRAASSWCEGQGLDDAAVAHAHEAGDDERLGELVWARAPGLLGTGRSAVLRRWLDGLGEQRITSSCALALTAAYVASHVGDTTAMTRLLLAAEARCQQRPPDRLARPGPLDVGLAKALEGHDGLRSMFERSSAAVEGLAPDDPWLTLAHYLRGMALLMIGRSPQAVADLQECLRLASAFGLTVMQAHALAALADAALLAGDVAKATARVCEARALVVANGLEHVTTTAPIFTTSAQVYVAEGRHGEAAAEAARALRLTGDMGQVAPWYAVIGRLQLARTFAVLGDRERAGVLLREARERYAPEVRTSVIDSLFEATDVLLRDLGPGLVGPSTLTTAELRVLQYLPSHLSYPEIGQELFLSRHTVKSQAMSAYRKLDVRSRSEAVARARALGLLPAP